MPVLIFLPKRGFTDRDTCGMDGCGEKGACLVYAAPLRRKRQRDAPSGKRCRHWAPFLLLKCIWEARFARK